MRTAASSRPIGAALPGATWQRCRTHYARNLMNQVPKTAWPWVATLLRTIFEQPDAQAVHAQAEQVITALEAKFPKAAAHLDEAKTDLLAFTGFPHEIWRQIWSNNSQERLNKEIRRRTDVVGIFPDRTSLIRLVGAVLADCMGQPTVHRPGRAMSDPICGQRRLMSRDLFVRKVRQVYEPRDDFATDIDARVEHGLPVRGGQVVAVIGHEADSRSRFVRCRR